MFSAVQSGVAWRQLYLDFVPVCHYLALADQGKVRDAPSPASPVPLGTHWLCRLKRARLRSGQHRSKTVC